MAATADVPPVALDPEELLDLLLRDLGTRRDGLPALEAGRAQEVGATVLVPGDVLFLAEGDRLSADARMLDGALEVDMSPITGESEPVTRTAASSRPALTPLDSDDLVFSGSLVTGGDAEAVVYATGMATQLRRIAALTQRVREVASPLQVQVDRAARLIAVVAFAAGGARELAVLATFPPLVWGPDEVRCWAAPAVWPCLTTPGTP
ncbi:MAG TPA: hypothetical protein VI006_05160 [Solirubrobacteraceae bacterium]